jgi:hypothetical protein
MGFAGGIAEVAAERLIVIAVADLKHCIPIEAASVFDFGWNSSLSRFRLERIKDSLRSACGFYPRLCLSPPCHYGRHAHISSYGTISVASSRKVGLRTDTEVGTP